MVVTTPPIHVSGEKLNPQDFHPAATFVLTCAFAVLQEGFAMWLIHNFRVSRSNPQGSNSKFTP